MVSRRKRSPAELPQMFRDYINTLRKREYVMYYASEVKPKNKRHPRPCKIGTVPGLVYLYRHYRLRPGLFIKFRDWTSPMWQGGIVWRVNSDGFFFINKT